MAISFIHVANGFPFRTALFLAQDVNMWLETLMYSVRPPTVVLSAFPPRNPIICQAEHSVLWNKKTCLGHTSYSLSNAPAELTISYLLPYSLITILRILSLYASGVPSICSVLVPRILALGQSVAILREVAFLRPHQARLNDRSLLH